ncbi:hypothetical protein R1sor_010249 [Riccia sorocarpa]|uniref:Uncharacterized protein n=1 Tax=Riccia sorocarpa TaxID=122646 RepID=A0ABD3HXQ6_9MARC
MVGELALDTSAFEPACQLLNLLRWTSSSLSGVHVCQGISTFCLGSGYRSMAPKTRNVGRKRKERSPIVEFPPEDAEELIDLTVSKIVETAEEGESSKHNEAAAASTAIEEKVKVWFDYTGSTKRNEGWNIDELRYFAKSGRDPALDKKCKLVMRQALKTIGRTSHIYCSTTVAFLAIAHVDPELENMRPDWHAWCANEIRFRLRHSKTDKHSKAKFREGWQAVVELVTRDFLAKQAARLHQQSSGLQLEYSSDAKNAFGETKVVWDAERGELIAERQRLRTELEEAQSREEQSSQKEEWEARNQRLSEDISVLHDEKVQDHSQRR